MIREGVQGSILVDNFKTEFYTPGNAKNLDLGGSLLTVASDCGNRQEGLEAGTCSWAG